MKAVKTWQKLEVKIQIQITMTFV